MHFDEHVESLLRGNGLYMEYLSLQLVCEYPEVHTHVPSRDMRHDSISNIYKDMTQFVL